MVASTLCLRLPAASAALSPTKVSSCALLRSSVAACSSSTFRVISEMSSSAEVLSWSACCRATSWLACAAGIYVQPHKRRYIRSYFGL